MNRNKLFIQSNSWRHFLLICFLSGFLVRFPSLFRAREWSVRWYLGSGGFQWVPEPPCLVWALLKSGTTLNGGPETQPLMTLGSSPSFHALPLPVYSTVRFLNDPELLNTLKPLPVHYSGASSYWNSSVTKIAYCQGCWLLSLSIEPTEEL